jgi:hypothetical protein
VDETCPKLAMYVVQWRPFCCGFWCRVHSIILCESGDLVGVCKHITLLFSVRYEKARDTIAEI